MKKETETWMLITGTILFLLSYMYDVQANFLFKNAKLPLIGAVLSIATNFGVVVMVMAVIPSILLYKKNRKRVYLLWTTFAASIAIAFVIKLIVLRQRPVEALNYPFTAIIDYSFPSMHAMAAFSLLPLLVKNMAKHKFFWIAFAFTVAFSRIYFRLHFLSDVVFGSAAGYLIGSYISRLHERGKLWQ